MTRHPDLGTCGDGRYRVVDEERIVANLVRNFWPYEAAEDHGLAVAEATRTLERWIAAGLPLRVDGGRRWFDPFEACNFALHAWLEDGDPLWLSHQVASSRRMVREMREDAAQSAGYTVTFRREFNLTGMAAGSAARLRIPLPIDRGRVDSTQILPGAVASGATASVSPGRLDIRFMMPEPASDTVTISATMTLPPGGSGMPLYDGLAIEPYDTASPEYRLCTRPDEGLIRVTDAVLRLADTLAGPRDPPAQVVARIWDYFTVQMKVGFIHYDELDIADPLGTVIERRWCDCHTGSALFAALCRARGIPARIVTGAVLYPIAPAQHSWLEVLLPPHGWLPVDILGAFLAARSLADGQWSRCFLGHLDPRLRTQCLPDLFTGAVGVRMPRSWYIVQMLKEGGNELTLGCLDDRAWVLRDLLRVSATHSPATVTAHASPPAAARGA
ncbi:MAG: transglutaminase domain-containing protein [Aromatoleum sp.]|nr:transglutaminase domain-containing protein [Aromatoleum sp.]